MKVLVLLLVMAQTAAAVPCSRISLLNEGEVAPCTGDLWPETASREAGKLKAVVLPGLQAEFDAARAIWEAEKARLEKQRDAAKERADKAEATAGVAAAAAPAVEFWEKPEVWGVIGTVAGVFAGVGGIALYEKLR